MQPKKWKNNNIPLYIRIRDDLRIRIEEGEWAPGMLIPPEKALLEEYGVSRITVLEAIKSLVREGLLYRKQGKGTFVAKPKILQSLNRFYGIAESLGKKGLALKRRILRAEIVKTNRHTAKCLGIKQGEYATEVVRLSLVDDDPFYVETIEVSLKLCPNFHSKNIESESMHNVLTNEYNIHLIKARECFEPIVIDDYEARILEVKRGTPALLLEHTTYTTKNRVVYFSKAIMRGDRCRYYTELE